jgi:hypothetical protein
MNKLYNLKNNQSNNFNVLSSTSSEFISHINLNKNLLFSKGGSNHTIEAFNAFNNSNLDLALYILNNNNFNCNIQDVNGNTILHHLVYNSKDNDKSINLINRILEFPNIEDFINLQNKYGQTPILVAVLNENDQIAELLDNAGADKSIKDNDGNFVKADEESDTNNRNIINIFNISPTTNVHEDTFEFIQKIKDEKSDLTSNMLKKLNNSNKTSDSSLQNVSDTDNFINQLKNKYNDNNKNKNNKNNNKNVFDLSDTSSLPSLNINSNNRSINKHVLPYDITSSMNESLNTDKQKLMNELTSDSNKSINSDSNKTITSSESINTEALLKAIDEIQGKQIGGSKKIKNKIMGYRNLVNTDSDNKNKNKINISSNYNLLYNSDSEYGNMNNELARMMRSQKNEIHQQVTNMIMGLLDKGILEKDSVQIEPTERNVKLIKAYIYRNISENNPQMGGLDKIIMFNKMTEQQIINLVKDMPDLDKLEKEIHKHIEEKLKNKPPKKSKNSDESQQSEESEESEEPKKKTKKESKSKKESKKDSKKKSKK